MTLPCLNFPSMTSQLVSIPLLAFVFKTVLMPSALLHWIRMKIMGRLWLSPQAVGLILETRESKQMYMV